MDGSTLKVKFKKISPNAVIPTKAHPTDAGFDLVATSKYKRDGCTVYGTGLQMEIPVGYVGLIFPRSSIAKTDLILSNSVGVIDSGYRGEIMFKFKYTSDIPYNFYEVGDRIGQLIIMPIWAVEFEEADTLSESDRGTGGFGSSGR